MLSQCEREGYAEEGARRIAVACFLLRKYPVADGNVASVAGCFRLEAAELKQEGNYLIRASKSDDEGVLRKATQVRDEGIFALRPTCVGQYNS
jgi:hypothetical protein